MTFRLILLPLLVLTLSACALPAAKVGTGAAAGWLSMAQTVGRDADEVLALDAPLKRKFCDEETGKSPRFEAWCANIPTDVSGLAVQWEAVASAPVKIER